MKVGTLMAALPGTRDEIARRIRADPSQVIGLITRARALGFPIVAVPDPTIANVPPKAKPEPGYRASVVYMLADEEET